ncbi:Trypsin [Enhygromyxa salina]|uniref:Trypsin n=1 Tax=Enhygromyxa salina TaxID=215803 RepID=A0A2S9YDA2_9BACT|nr:Trypsin [Enhygromyxa salina]
MLCTVGLVVGVTATAAASPPAAVEASEPALLIAHGEDVAACAWPTAVAVLGGAQCSGTLIHPEIVVYAAHCGGGFKTIRFGEDAQTGGTTVEAPGCRAYPNYAGDLDQGHDWAYCRLPAPITGLPPTPPLFGCETALLEVGSEVALVGFGQSTEAASGIKRWAATTLVAVTPGNNTTLVGNPDIEGTPSTCLGDSGGPAFLQLGDGSWRTFGIASTSVGACGGYGAHSGLAGAVAWIERDSGVDVTPCHAADGSWAPGPACAGANRAAANVGSGSWADWCSGTPASGASSSCGPAWDQFDSTLLPSVEIVSPSWGQTFLDGALVNVEVAATKHPEGYALARVRLEIDELEVASDDNDPWLFEATAFPGVGVYTLVAVAEDWAGNEVASAPVMIGLGEVEVPDPDQGTESGEGGSEDAGGGAESEGPGCSCATHEPRPLGLLVFVALLGYLRAPRGATLTSRWASQRRAARPTKTSSRRPST